MRMPIGSGLKRRSGGVGLPLSSRRDLKVEPIRQPHGASAPDARPASETLAGEWQLANCVHVIETWKKRVREYRTRAGELRAKAESLTDIRELNSAVRDAEMYERMADWEERNPPPTD